MRRKQPTWKGLQNDRRSTGPIFRVLLSAIILLLFTTSQASAGNQFVRGDANGDGAVDISDGIATLQYLFSCGSDCPMVCDDAADFDDNGAIEMTDAIRIFGFLFQGDSAPESPYPDAGEDSTEDGLSCGVEATSVEQVGGGSAHTCASTEEGDGYCWGDGSEGRLGDGNSADQLIPSLVQLDAFADQIAVGSHHTCFLSDGTVWCTGYNQYGQLGDGTEDDRDVPVEVSGLTDVVQIAAGGDHTCALGADGTVSCWGYNSYGQLGGGPDGYNSIHVTPIQVVDLTGVTKIAAGWSHTCALGADGTVSCWGRSTYGASPGTRQESMSGETAYLSDWVPALIEDLPEVVDIAAGVYHNCAITSEGAAWCWGANSHGQCGNGASSTTQRSPVEVVALTDIESMSLGMGHSCALTVDGSVHCWGWNLYGEIGDGTDDERHTPFQVDVEEVLEVGTGTTFTCALSAREGLWCWGKNSSGQLGDNSTDHRLSPVRVIFPEEE